MDRFRPGGMQLAGLGVAPTSLAGCRWLSAPGGLPRPGEGLILVGPGLLPFPRPGRLARRGGGVKGGACAIAHRRRRRPGRRRRGVDDHRPRELYLAASMRLGAVVKSVLIA